jgi:hypothetical protein
MARAMLRWVGIAMKDLLFILITLAFFVVAWRYARSLEKL